jgi:hypothetical protein
MSYKTITVHSYDPSKWWYQCDGYYFDHEQFKQKKTLIRDWWEWHKTADPFTCADADWDALVERINKVVR